MGSCRVATSGIGTPFGAAAVPETAAVDLYWLPLGAGGHSVRLNGRVFEAAAARAERRPACDLYHSALEVRVAAATAAGSGDAARLLSQRSLAVMVLLTVLPSAVVVSLSL